MNPFIYAIKHEGVKEKLAGLMVWRERVRRWWSGGVAVAPEISGSNARNVDGGTQRLRTGNSQTR